MNVDEDIEDNNNKKDEKEGFVPTDNTPRPPTGALANSTANRKHTILSGFVKELSQESSQLSLWWGQSLSNFITNDQLYDTLLSRNIFNGIPDEAKPELKLHSSPQTAICFSHQVKSKDINITSSLILIWEVESKNTLTVFKSFLKKSSFKVRPSSQPAPSRTFPLSLLAQVHIIEG